MLTIQQGGLDKFRFLHYLKKVINAFYTTHTQKLNVTTAFFMFFFEK